MSTSSEGNVENERALGSGSPAEAAAAGERTEHRRANGVWAAVVVGLIALLALLLFILDNGRDVRVSYLGAHGHLPLGIALLLAAVFGALVVVFAGVARILQLRRRAKRRQP